MNGFFFYFKENTTQPKNIFFLCRQIVLRRAFNKLDKDGSGFLTRDEILDAASNEAELDASAENISDLLIYLVTDDDKKVDFPYCADKHGIYF